MEHQRQTATPTLDVSVVVPFRDEEGTLLELADRVTTVLREHGRSFELILVDDGSTDNSWAIAVECAARFPEARAIRMRRNFGKATALGTGFHFAAGAVVITMDADLQDDPKELPRFIAAIEEGYDLVSGWKRVRHDPVAKTAPSKLFNAVARRGSGVELHDFNCGFKAYRAVVATALAPHLYGEMHRYLPVLAGAHGFRIAELEVEHHPRVHGRSKYGLMRMLAGACDLLSVMLLTRFRHRPLHAFGGAAAIMLAVTALAAIGVAALGEVALAFEAGALGALGGIVLLACGLVCETVVMGIGPSPVKDRLAEMTREPRSLNTATSVRFADLEAQFAAAAAESHG